MENNALLTVTALMLAGMAIIMLARSEGDAAEDAFSGAAFELHKSVDPQPSLRRVAVIQGFSATSAGYSIEEGGYINDEVEESAPVGL